MEAPVAVSQSPAARNGNGERGRAVDAAILQIEKQFGRGAIMRLGDREVQNIPAVSTGATRSPSAIYPPDRMPGNASARRGVGAPIPAGPPDEAGVP